MLSGRMKSSFHWHMKKVKVLARTHTGSSHLPMDVDVAFNPMKLRYETAGRHKDVVLYFATFMLNDLYVDAKVCCRLCVGEPIKYKMKKVFQPPPSDDWLFEHVVPNIRRRCPIDSRFCKVLAHTLLFAAMDGELGEMMSPEVRNRITQAYLIRYPNPQQQIELNEFLLLSTELKTLYAWTNAQLVLPILQLLDNRASFLLNTMVWQIN
jgi:hypothetical protein